MYRKTIDELQEDTRDKQIIDLRSEEDFEKETYPGAMNLYWEDLGERVDEIAKDKPVYLICYTGQKSDEIAQNLQEQGYETYSVEGGYRAYLRKKLADFMKPDENQEERLADRTKDVERSIIKKFKKTIWRPFTKAINEYEMIKDGDKIAVCISGGKDSMLMAKLFQELERHGKKNFEVVFLVMNPGYNDVNYETILNNAKILNVPITVFKTEIFDTVADITDSPCYLCARMRRGHLYSKARELGCNKIALGHHFDDVIEEFDRIIGKDQIAVFHINDSKNVPGAAKDRHENIGFGHIGFEAINYIVHHADFRDVPKILETPYIPSVENPKKSYAPYKYEIEMLRAGKFDPDMKERIVKEHEKSV